MDVALDVHRALSLGLETLDSVLDHAPPAGHALDGNGGGGGGRGLILGVSRQLSALQPNSGSGGGPDAACASHHSAATAAQGNGAAGLGAAGGVWGGAHTAYGYTGVTAGPVGRAAAAGYPSNPGPGALAAVADKPPSGKAAGKGTKDLYGRTGGASKAATECPVCMQKVAAARFAQHLERCMAGGGSRHVSKRSSAPDPARYTGDPTQALEAIHPSYEY
jgi:hypothetical protein